MATSTHFRIRQTAVADRKIPGIMAGEGSRNQHTFASSGSLSIVEVTENEAIISAGNITCISTSGGGIYLHLNLYKNAAKDLGEAVRLWTNRLSSASLSCPIYAPFGFKATVEIGDQTAGNCTVYFSWTEVA